MKRFLISHEHPSILNLYANLQIYNKYEHKSTAKEDCSRDVHTYTQSNREQAKQEQLCARDLKWMEI